jgi:NAD(P)-dependent dehydrogenase (short-subunit alcohol dehydrogenase family)
MAGRLFSRTALITGTSSGLGRAIALAYAREGANVICTDIAPTARATLPGDNTEPTDKLIRQLGGAAKFVICDISEPADVRRAVMDAVDSFGRLDMYRFLFSPYFYS